MEDERRGVPSASGVVRVALCPGSWLLENQCPNTTSDAAESGTRIHAVLAGEIPASELSDDEQRVADRCHEMDERLPELIGFDGEFDADIRECRLWSDGDPRRSGYSGKPDRIRISHSAGLILVTDYKTGYGDVPPAESNWQMRALASLAYRIYDIPCVYVALIAPRTVDSLTICKYGRDDLLLAHRDISDKIELASNLDAPRIPGEEQCKYCRAKAICPEARAAALAITKYDAGAGEAIAVPTLTAEQLAEALPQLDNAEKIIKAIRDQAKIFVAAGGAIPGYEEKPGVTRREIPDAQAAFAAVSDIITPEEYQTACSVSVAALEALYGAKAGLKGKALKSAFAERLGDALVSKQAAPSLVRSKSVSHTNAITE